MGNQLSEIRGSHGGSEQADSNIPPLRCCINTSMKAAGLLYSARPQPSNVAMKLIGSLTSPYVRKTRIVLAEKKLEYEFVLENVWEQDSTIQQYNPLGKVPCLIMDDGGALFDSRVIVEYLDTLSPVGR